MCNTHKDCVNLALYKLNMQRIIFNQDFRIEFRFVALKLINTLCDADGD